MIFLSVIRMINLHSHTIHSDGCLLPSELAVRYAAAGYQALAITDHADYSNIETAVKAVVTFCAQWPSNAPIRLSGHRAYASSFGAIRAAGAFRAPRRDISNCGAW
jgi:histidinol phosphatase-like PHP family hydrolase